MAPLRHNKFYNTRGYNIYCIIQIIKMYLISHLLKVNKYKCRI